MGWGNCGTDSKGRPIGYAVAATCDEEGCETKIDRGLSYCCGDMHGEDEVSCEKYFCCEHRSCPSIPEELFKRLEREQDLRLGDAGLCSACCRLFERCHIEDELADFYPDIADRDTWLSSPHRLLGGKTPSEIIEQGKASEVFAVIDQIRTGAYV